MVRKKQEYKQISVTKAVYERLEVEKKEFEKTIGGGSWSFNDTINEYHKILDMYSSKEERLKTRESAIVEIPLEELKDPIQNCSTCGKIATHQQEIKEFEDVRIEYYCSSCMLKQKELDSSVETSKNEN